MEGFRFLHVGLVHDIHWYASTLFIIFHLYILLKPICIRSLYSIRPYIVYIVIQVEIYATIRMIQSLSINRRRFARDELDRQLLRKAYSLGCLVALSQCRCIFSTARRKSMDLEAPSKDPCSLLAAP
jgi:hypothetical protein